jgi:hypothetical protein
MSTGDYIVLAIIGLLLGGILELFLRLLEEKNRHK